MKHTPETRSFFWFEYSDLEQIITEHFGIKEYNIAVVEEVPNNICLCKVVKQTPLQKYDLKTIESVKAGEEPTFSLGAVMCQLCVDNVIPPGEYLIYMSW